MKKPEYLSLLLFAAIFLMSGCAQIRSALIYEDPLTAVENNNLGVAYEREGEYELAIREYKKAIKKDNDFTVAVINLANIYVKTEKTDKAGKYYKKALETEPLNLVARNNLANLYMNTNKDYKSAIALMTGIEIPEEELAAYYLDTLGDLYQLTGDTDKAIQKYLLACKKLVEGDELEKILDEKLKELTGSICTSEH